jgi:predicted nucleic acid-binding protein
MPLVDSNVLLDLFSAGQPWVAWSKQQLERVLRRGPVFINDVIYAEISLQFAAFEALDAALKEILIDLIPMPRPALFLAGRAFRQYRTAGGLRTGVLSDFYWCSRHSSASPDRDSRRPPLSPLFSDRGINCACFLIKKGAQLALERRSPDGAKRNPGSFNPRLFLSRIALCSIGLRVLSRIK